jgi:hypothetical protein
MAVDKTTTLNQWDPKVLLKLLHEKKYNFTVEGTNDKNTLRLILYTPDRLKDQPALEKELTILSKNKNNNLSWDSAKSKTSSSGTIIPTEVTIKDKKYVLIFKPDKFDPRKTSSADKYGKLSIKLKPSEIKVFTNINLQTVVTDAQIRHNDYLKKGKIKDDGSNLYPIEITNRWLTIEQMIKRTKYYLNSKSSKKQKDANGNLIKGLDLPKPVLKEFDSLFSRVMDGTSLSIKINLNLSPASAEFFEVLSAIKMAALLRAKNKYLIEDVLFLPKEDVTGSIQPKIYIPKEPNFPLLDYYVTLKNLTGNHEIDAKNAIKISVKSHISSPTVETNTVKLDQVFHTEQELIKWYSGIKNQTVKATQKYPMQTAESAISVKLSGGSAPMFPIETVSKFLNEEIAGKTKEELTEVLEKFGQKNYNTFSLVKIYTKKEILDAVVKIIKIVGPKLKTYRKTTPLSDAGIKGKDLAIITEVFQKILITDKIKADQVEISMQNLAFICERVLAAGSRPPSHLKLNFYKMFYDQVLAKYKIAYAMPTINKKGGDTVKFKYIAVKNWNKEYEEVKKLADQYWLQLRGKTSTNAAGDAIGISV